MNKIIYLSTRVKILSHAGLLSLMLMVHAYLVLLPRNRDILAENRKFSSSSNKSANSMIEQYRTAGNIALQATVVPHKYLVPPFRVTAQTR